MSLLNINHHSTNEQTQLYTTSIFTRGASHQMVPILHILDSFCTFLSKLMTEFLYPQGMYSNTKLEFHFQWHQQNQTFCRAIEEYSWCVIKTGSPLFWSCLTGYVLYLKEHEYKKLFLLASWRSRIADWVGTNSASNKMGFYKCLCFIWCYYLSSVSVNNFILNTLTLQNCMGILRAFSLYICKVVIHLLLGPGRFSNASGKH